MSGLRDEDRAPGAAAHNGAAANAWALLHELEALVAALLHSGKSASIDLRGVPMSSADRAVLEGVLGVGEVNARLEALGTSQVRETAIHGVWWVTHCNEQADVVAESLEVSFCPEILFSHREDVAVALEDLRTCLTQNGWVRSDC